ncbi:MAG: hypothetical protein ACRD82_20515 [Blastocatellia bacterium]
MNNQDANNESIIIEDLAAENAEEIKGGPTHQSKRDVILKSSVADEQTDGGNTLQGWSLNHNETVSEDNQALEAETQKLTDLPVAGEQVEQVKGGRSVYTVTFGGSVATGGTPQK